MNRLLMSTAIVGLAALPGFAIAQSDQADETINQEQTEMNSQVETDSEVGTDMEDGAQTGTESDMNMDSDSTMDESHGTDDSATSGMDSAGSGDRPAAIEGNTEVDAATVEASEVEGAPVMSRDGEEIANVSEVLLSEDGSVEAIIVNVGGVLGIGSKPVEVSFDEVTLQTNDEDEELSIIIPMSEQELEDMPRYEEN